MAASLLANLVAGMLAKTLVSLLDGARPPRGAAVQMRPINHFTIFLAADQSVLHLAQVPRFDY